MDWTATDPHHKNYDPKYTKETCPWVAVKVKLDRILPSIITLQQLKDAAVQNPSMAQMILLRRPRLSVSEITEEQWNTIIELHNSRSVS
jgi:predicted RNA-binding protein with PUA-like domain